MEWLEKELKTRLEESLDDILTDLKIDQETKDMILDNCNMKSLAWTAFNTVEPTIDDLEESIKELDGNKEELEELLDSIETEKNLAMFYNDNNSYKLLNELVVI